ncbi:Pkinase-domain-containing protein [Sistotremastrum suecicum HHB10207 ss-3]|uniref:mitogen-activated protein kinase kinase kinase n=1 Tax=Sistotremastrum suecicum HHB10207 ss-3 TaxID=1314776 RepID=A0A166GVA0_9AGAM|nr:Pkinase-domain-containing protein [Sistotremastrum suecicum HHB10207 ss-3]
MAQQPSLSTTPTSPNFSPSPSITLQSHARPNPSRPDSPSTLPSLQQPDSVSGTSYREFLKTWNDSHVHRWLQDYGVGALASTFAANDIRSDVLLELEASTLKEMGITSIGDRIKILNAVRQLRQRCSSHWPRSKVTTQPRVMVDSTADATDKEGHEAGSNQRISRKLDSGRPPPLHLSPTARSDLPRVDRQQQSASNGLESAKSLQTPRMTPQGLSASNIKHQHNLPPAAPPPRSQPPLPPSDQARLGLPATPRRPLGVPTTPYSSGRRTPTQIEAPPFTNQPLPPAPGPAPGSQTPSSSTPGTWTGEYGLPPRPSPGNLGGKPGPNRAASPLGPPQLNIRRAGMPNNFHGTASPSRQLHERTFSLPNSSPSTSNQSRLPIANNLHPYASPNSHNLLPPSAAVNQLSPVSESFASQPREPPSFSSLSTSSNAGTEYRVGRGPFPRPNTPQQAGRSIEDIRRKTIKFHLPQESASRVVNVADCEDGTQVLEKALKKFGKLGSPSITQAHEESKYIPVDDFALSVDGWGLFMSWMTDEGYGKALSEAEILATCHSEPDHPVREHGLTLRRVTGGKQKRSGQSGNAMTSPPTTPNQPGSAKTSGPDGEPEQSLKPSEATKKMNRASSISILSGLGVNPERALDLIGSAPSIPSTQPATSSSPRSSNFPSKLRNFFGQRPPSELITTHLQEFFPFTEKKVLERTRRHSMMRSNTVKREPRRDSLGPGGSEHHPLPSSRFSMSSAGSREPRMSTSPPPPLPHTVHARPNTEMKEPPRMSLSTEDGQSQTLVPEDDYETDRASIASSKRSDKRMTHLLPPVNFPNESLSESLSKIPGLTRSTSTSSSAHRYSYMSELRNKRDRSDTASMLTVDEITAEVESRRGSWVDLRASDAQETPTPTTAKEIVASAESAGLVEPRSASPEAHPEDDEEEEVETEVEDDEDEYEDDESDEAEEEKEYEVVPDGPSKAMTSTGGKRSIKWHKGALIGSGSFGQVYLGMDAQHGLLMAVKQVELPTGASQNEERKKSMLTALEREIELLKELQHDNIVQYLDSSIDDTYLNIFLEYVPGGSVAALLRNYGAFEEALVRNFVRQICTGLDYLHERDIIHRDIKGANILVDNKGGVKISDFGISKKVEDNLLNNSRAHRPSLQGSVFWMAPEVVKQTSYTRKADIWSVGCLVVEMLTGEHPWANLTQMQAIFKIGSSAKPTIPSDISAYAVDFLEKTFDLDYLARPTADQLLLHPWIIKDPASVLGTHSDNMSSVPVVQVTS